MTTNPNPLAGVPAVEHSGGFPQIEHIIRLYVKAEEMIVNQQQQLAEANAQAAAMREQVEILLVADDGVDREDDESSIVGYSCKACDYSWAPAQPPRHSETCPRIVLQSLLTNATAGRDLLDRLQTAEARVERLRAYALAARRLTWVSDRPAFATLKEFGEYEVALKALQPGDLGDE